MWHAVRTKTFLILFFLFGRETTSQDFVRVKNGMLDLNGNPFSFVGANAYYLQQLTAKGQTAEVQEVLSTATANGLRCLRTWGFYDSPDSLNPAVIQYKPGKFNEHALRALDYVLAEADRFGIKLVIPLVNNWEDFGGMNQYVRWYAESSGRKSGASAPSVQLPEAQQNTARIEGPMGRFYRIHVAAGFTHDDFYRIDEIKRWYKAYVSMVLARVNTFNGRRYADDPTVLAWELANEPRSSDRSGEIVRAWISEMADFVKFIDRNHLLGTGEEGFDVSRTAFHLSSEYSNQAWLFDGTTGVSFTVNLQVPNVDVASIHLYSEAWKFSATDGTQWILDHAEVSRRLGKPLILGEFGAISKRQLVYEGWLNALLQSQSAGGLVWQVVPDNWKDSDKYAFTCSREPVVCDLLASYASHFSVRDKGGQSVPATFSLKQNFPNPFNDVTVIRYDLRSASQVRLDVFNSLGQKVATIFEGWESSGSYAKIFEASRIQSGVTSRSSYASGLYFYRLQTGEFTETRRMLFLK